MPEIAEVETVRNTLKKRILKERIHDVKVFYDGIIIGNKDEFIKRLINESFIDILRNGKWLIFETDNYYMLSHLRMEGKYFIKNEDEERNKHEHVIFYLDHFTLRYHDTRKFGKLKLIRKDELANEPLLTKLGIEPISRDLNGQYVYDKIHKKNKYIKTLLLDQSIINGLGNIYADEVLFKSRINPMKKGYEITLDECNRICLSANEIIKEAIKCGGTTIRSYTSSLGVTGRFQQNLMVHKRSNESCKICGNKIINTFLNGRNTYYCPNCQK